MPVQTTIQYRRDSATNWATVNPVLAAGEIGFETNTGKFKIGDGSTAWTSLTYATDGSKLTGTITATTAGTAVYATNAGTSVYATTSGTATYATTSGTATYATTAGTAVNISGTIAPSQVTGTAAVLGANTFVAAQILSPTAGVALTANGVTDAVTLIVKGGVSNTAALQQWQDSGSAVRASVSSAGAFTISPSSGTALTVNGAATTSVTLIVKAIASQTADLAQYQSSDATVRGGRNALAQIYSGSTAPVTVATGGAISGTSSGTTATLTSASAHGLAVGDLVTIAGMTPSGYNGTYLVATVPTTTTFTVTTSGSNLGNSTVSGTASVPAQASITARSAGTVGLVVKAAASAVADTQRWTDSSNTVLAKINNAGAATFGSLELTSGALTLQGSAVVAGQGNNGGSIRISKADSALAGVANYVRLMVLAGTNANTLKLIAVGPGGTVYTIQDNMN